MADKTAFSDIKYLFFIPSFYGALTWGAWLVLYLLKLVGVDDPGSTAMSVFLFAEAMFILSAYVSYPYYRSILQARPAESIGERQESPVGIKTAILLLHAVGFIGVIKYVIDISRNLGGIAGFLLALVNEAYAIRWENETTISIGTQLTYVGWIAIALTVYQLQRKRISAYWLIPALFQLSGNLLYIDRTRPFWILFTSILMILPAAKTLHPGRLFRLAAGTTLIAVMIFWAVAEWTGKTTYEGKFEESVLPGITQEIYVYGVSGFAYFNKMLDGNEQISSVPERFLYPLIKYLAKLGFTKEPPSQVIDFYDVPFSTNVGTFLEPFYRDGGLLFVLCGIIIYSFGIDFAANFFLRQNTPVALFVWANLCFTSLIGFAVPKLSSFPVWLFAILGVGGMLLTSAQRLADQPGRPET
ncbi:MAG: oligosaccharide repeat unit polymerase [Geobacteraceae bacterium]|nr:oligosaccharide repeat unit polymerase [Geobacteraceae bacterium]